MIAWKCTAAAFLVGITGAAQAQDGVDWGSIMHAEAMGSAMEEAAKEDGKAPRVKRTLPPTRGANPQTRANCAKARGWAASGVRDARLPNILGLCKRLGY